jgi:hypothetical protein
LAELTPLIFKQVLRASKATAAIQIFQDEMEHTVKKLLASDNFLDSMSDAPVSMSDGVPITCLRNLCWAKDPYNVDKKSVKDQIGIPHFAMPRQDSMQYKERLAASRTIYWQEHVGEDKSRLVHKLSELYHYGKIQDAASIHVILANLWLLVLWQSRTLFPARQAFGSRGKSFLPL